MGDGKTIGGIERETSRGYGVVFVIHDNFYFYHMFGPKQNQIVKQFVVGSNTYEMPYKYMSKVDIDMNRGNVRDSIHSTVGAEKIWLASTGGCVRVSISDMVKLKPLIPLGAQAHSFYDTIKVSKKKGFVHIYPDVYGEGTNNLENLKLNLELAGVSTKGMDVKKLEDIVKRSMLVKDNCLLESLYLNYSQSVLIVNTDFKDYRDNLEYFWIKPINPSTNL